MQEMLASLEPKYLSVTELNELINSTLESTIPKVTFEGEISQITRAASGHIYLTLKDENCQVSAVMWRGTAQSLDFKPDEGLAVLCHGRPNFILKEAGCKS